MRLGLEAACARAGNETVVFSGSTVTAYLDWRAFSASPPADVVVLDLTLGDGTTVTENVRRLVLDGSSVIIHSVADRPAAVREALAAGAAGIVSKSSPIGDVIAAIRTVARGEPLNNVEWASAVEGDRAFADAQLSARERDVLRLYAAGLPLKVVADRLGVAYSTAKENITRVRVKYVEVGRPAPDEGRPAAPRDGGRHPVAARRRRCRWRLSADRRPRRRVGPHPADAGVDRRDRVVHAHAGSSASSRSSAGFGSLVLGAQAFLTALGAAATKRRGWHDAARRRDVRTARR